MCVLLHYQIQTLICDLHNLLFILVDLTLSLWIDPPIMLERLNLYTCVYHVIYTHNS